LKERGRVVIDGQTKHSHYNSGEYRQFSFRLDFWGWTFSHAC